MSMSIKEFIKKSKDSTYENRDVFIAIIIILVAFASFGLGRLSKIEETRSPVRIENMTASVIGVKESATMGSTRAQNKSNSQLTQTEIYVGSINGSKYHYPWCSGAQRIKESNKIQFSSKEEAIKAGYTPAANCKGLK